MALGYLLSPALQVENINGKPLVGGTITVYRHGTTNPYITYKDFTGDRNPADVVLNDKGMAVILADPNLVYDVYCRDADGVEQWSRLNVTVADPIGAGDGRIYNITSTDGSITATSDVDPATGVTSFDLSLTNPPDATLTVRHETNRDGAYDTLGTFTATGPNNTITVPKEAYSFRIGTRACYYNDVLNAYLTNRPVFAYEIYSWYEEGQQKEDVYQYMAMKQYWGDNNFYDGTANIQFVRVDVDNNRIVMQKCLPESPGSITGYAKWEKTELPLDEGAGVFYVEYGTTTFADAEAAYLAGKTLVCREIGQTLQQTRTDDLYFLIGYTANGSFVFSNISGAVQTNVRLSPSATYEKTMNTMATRQEVVDTLAAEIAPEYITVVQQHYDEDSFPIPAGTYVTYLDNTSSSVLQYLYRSKVAIERWEAGDSDPSQAPQKWDRIHVVDELGKGVAYVDILQTPFADVLSLYNQGKHIVGRNGYEFYRMIGYSEAWGAITGFSFQNINGPVIYTWRVTSDGPSETNNWVTPPDIYFNAWIGTSAAPYDETRTYSVGDVVSRDYNLYRCNTDISVAEPWTVAHWTQTTVAAELARFATVARTGDYNDLSNKPAIPAAQVNADWNASSGVAEILNKPDLGVYATATDLSTGLAAKQDVIGDLSTIRSGAAAGATAVQPGDLATVATSGDYADLSNKPAIPAALSAGDGVDITNNVVSAKVDGTTIVVNQNTGELEALIGSPDVFIAEYNVTPYDDIAAAVQANKSVFVKYATASDYFEIFPLVLQNEGVTNPFMIFQGFVDNYTARQVTVTKIISSGTTLWSITRYDYQAHTLFDSSLTYSYDSLTHSGSLSVTNPLPSSSAADADKVLTVDSNGDPAWMSPSYGLFEAVYGQTSYADIVDAINAHKIVYCRISATGASRMAFLAYIGNDNAEFQYYRSLSSHSASNQTDEVYVYTVASTGWTTTTRLAGIKYAAGTHMTSSFSNNTLTFQSVWPDVDQTYDGTSTNAQSGTAIAGELANYTPTSSLATVATTGDYADLSNTPTIPAAQVNADWDSSSGVSEILNKPTPKTLVAGTGIVITETANSIVISLA